MMESKLSQKVMSKIYNSQEVTAEFCTYELKTYDISELEGKLLTHIDATFSDVQQRKAQKDIIRSLIWNWILPKAIAGNGNDVSGIRGK